MHTHTYIFLYLCFSHYCLSFSVMLFLKKIQCHLAALSGKGRTVYIYMCLSTWPGHTPFRGAFMLTNRSPGTEGWVPAAGVKRIREPVSPQKFILPN